MTGIDAQEATENAIAVFEDALPVHEIGNILGDPFQVSLLADLAARAVHNTALHYRARGEPASPEVLDSAMSETVRHIGESMAVTATGTPLSDEDIRAMDEIAVCSLAQLLKGETIRPITSTAPEAEAAPVAYDA